jgi:hypothetical protein
LAAGCCLLATPYSLHYRLLATGYWLLTEGAVAFRPRNTAHSFFGLLSRAERARGLIGVNGAEGSADDLRPLYSLPATPYSLHYRLLAIGYLLLAIKKSAPPAVGPRLSSHSGGGALKTNLAAHRIEQCDFRHSRFIAPVENLAFNRTLPGAILRTARLTLRDCPACYRQTNPRASRPADASRLAGTDLALDE